MTARARILLVDDKVEDGKPLRSGLRRRAEFKVRTPERLAEQDLAEADLVLVDYDLRLADAGESPVLAAPNGLALSGVIRERLHALRTRPSGVALYTGEIDKIAGVIPNEVRNYVVARLNNLEWAFEKGVRGNPAMIASLADGVRALPHTWPHTEPAAAERALHRLLALDTKRPFYETASREIDDCHPPIHELSESTHALSVIRWLAHRILPYPTFLVDQLGLAARMRVDPGAIDEILGGRSRLAADLDEVSYEGALSELVGPRWWRAGVESLMYDLSGGGGLKKLKQALRQRSGKARLRFRGTDVVPVIDASYRPGRLAPADECVRLRPDDWPVFADDAWATREEVDDSAALRGLVLPADRDLLDG